MRPARFRLVMVTAAAVFTAVLGWRLGWRGDMLAANLCAIIVGLLVDVAMYLRDIQKGRRHTPASQRLADALAAVRPDAEAAVAKASAISAEYLDRALTAEAAIRRVRTIKKAPGRSPDNLYTNAQDDGWDQALDEVRDALDDPEPEPCTCTFNESCSQCSPVVNTRELLTALGLLNDGQGTNTTNPKGL